MGRLINRAKSNKLIAVGLFLASLLVASPAFAWRHGVAIGYGYGQEIDAPYLNTGLFIRGIIYRFNNIDKFLIFTVDISGGIWKAHTVSPNTLNTIALSPNFRAYFIDPATHRVRPYIEASFGPTYLSAKQFGTERQGSHFAFQTTLGGGIEVGSLRRAVDLGIHFIHYCNAGLSSPNDGSDIPMVFTVGFLFS